jgi:hypothetical protein
LASIKTHFLVTSAGFAEKVFMREIRERGRQARSRRTAGFLDNGTTRVNIRV